MDRCARPGQLIQLTKQRIVSSKQGESKKGNRGIGIARHESILAIVLKVFQIRAKF